MIGIYVFGFTAIKAAVIETF